MRVAKLRGFVTVMVCLGLAGDARAQGARAAPSQTEEDEYTRYELLAPETASFRITYHVTATTAGTRYYWNGIRRGSQVSDIAVIDPAGGVPLKWELVDTQAARANGFAEAGEEGRYLQIRLPRPVPEGGETRLRILKTYQDAKSYFAEGERIVFDRTLGIRRNAVVLPAGYELVGVDYPSQVRTLADGRTSVSFMNHGRAGVPYRVVGRKLAVAPPGVHADVPPAGALPGAPPGTGGRIVYSFDERASQDREIVYHLQPPETHSFRLYHDYTETREGTDRYLNVVRTGSKASDPSAINLDTGEALKVETLKGAAARARGIKPDQDAFDDTSEVVVIWFPAVQKGRSVRLRIWETYTDPGRYTVLSHRIPAEPPGKEKGVEELIWHRAFGRPHNAVVLPAGWRLTASSIPATVSLLDDGRIRLDYLNDRPDDIDVLIRAERR